MLVSFFETVRYPTPPELPREWPVASGACDPEAGAEAYQAMIERLRFVEELGFDWVSLSEHHYSPRILTPSPLLSAAYVAARVPRIKVALLGPIVPHSNPVRIAEETAMLDALMPGRLVVGMLRGTTNEYLSYDINPKEARERTDEGMELVLKAWTEPQPFGWQGRYYQFRTVSIWPRPAQQPHPPAYALGTSREAAEFAARHHIGLGVSYGPFEVMAKSAGHYRAKCAEYGWQPGRDQIVYRANMVLAETDEKAHDRLEKLNAQAPFPVRPALRDALLEADIRNVAGERRPASVGRILPTTFCGGPDAVVDQIAECRKVVGAGVLDLSLEPPGSGDSNSLRRSLELFGSKVLPRIRDI